MELGFKLAVIVFMVGSLLQLGLQVDFADTTSGLRDWSFLGIAFTFAFVVGPALAWGITEVLPLPEFYAKGLMLLSLTPGAPFLPMLVRRACCDMTRVPAMLLISAAGTTMILPLALPVVLPGGGASSIAIAGPIAVFLIVPCMIGMTLARVSPVISKAILRPVEAVTQLATIASIVLCIVLYGDDFMDAMGRLAVAAQVGFLVTLAGLSYIGARGLPRDSRVVIALGLSTRNVGAAIAPLLSTSGAIDGVVVMVLLGVPVQMIVAAMASTFLSRRSRPRVR